MSLPLAVIVPVYRRARTLQETLQFVLAQTRLPQALVIVDDGSQDATADAAETWLRAQNPSFDWQVVRAAHRGAAASRNTGFQAVRDLPLVSFLDSVDHWPADFLDRACRRFETVPDTVAVSADRVFSGTGLVRLQTGLDSLPEDPPLWFIRHDAGIASCTVLARQAVEDSGGWPVHVTTGEDFLLFSAIARLGPWRHLPGAPVRFNRATERTTGEHINLSRDQALKYREWARQAEQLLAEVGEDDPARREAYRKAVAARWASAGNHFVRKRMFREARNAFQQAVALGAPPLSLRLRAAASRVLAWMHRKSTTTHAIL